MNREILPCPACGAAIGAPCDFGTEPPWTIVEDGEERRVVHAARYALTLPEAEVAAFWDGAIDKYLAEQLAALPPDAGDQL